MNATEWWKELIAENRAKRMACSMRADRPFRNQRAGFLLKICHFYRSHWSKHSCKEVIHLLRFYMKAQTFYNYSSCTLLLNKSTRMPCPMYFGLLLNKNTPKWNITIAALRIMYQNEDSCLLFMIISSIALMSSYSLAIIRWTRQGPLLRMYSSPWAQGSI